MEQLLRYVIAITLSIGVMSLKVDMELYQYRLKLVVIKPVLL